MMVVLPVIIALLLTTLLHAGGALAAGPPLAPGARGRRPSRSPPCSCSSACGR